MKGEKRKIVSEKIYLLFCSAVFSSFFFFFLSRSLLKIYSQFDRYPNDREYSLGVYICPPLPPPKKNTAYVYMPLTGRTGVNIAIAKNRPLLGILYSKEYKIPQFCVALNPSNPRRERELPNSPKV